MARMRLGRLVVFAALTAAMVAAGAMATGNSPRTFTSVGQAVPQCGRCHGGADNFAPPRTPGGASETTDLGVGAHQTHVRAGPLREAIPCQECHVVPAREDDPGH